MDIRDEFIPEVEFATVLDRVPQVCVEVVLERDGQVLLAHRTRAPAKDEWFWPGSRLYKGEELDDAARRVARDELGVDVAIEGRLGVYEHFWDTSAIDGVDSRHTINIVYRVRQTDPGEPVELDEQHDDYRFVDPGGDGAAFHEYVRQYLAALDGGCD
jgi:colanic acid biosynthesis protein WcaH